MPKYATKGTGGRGRSYRIPGIDTPLTSVTTAIGVLNKPALVTWAARMAAERALKEADDIKELLEAEGFEMAQKYIMSASSSYANDRRTLGSIVHWLAQTYKSEFTAEQISSKVDWYLRKVRDPDAIRQEAYDCFDQYVDWTDAMDVRFVLREHTVCNMAEGYAGTLDCVCDIRDPSEWAEGGLLTRVGDIKTGGVYPESVALQLAAYRHADYYVDSNDELHPMPAVYGGFVLNLKKGGWDYIPYNSGLEAYQRFLDALHLYEWTCLHPEAMERA